MHFDQIQAKLRDFDAISLINTSCFWGFNEFPWFSYSNMQTCQPQYILLSFWKCHAFKVRLYTLKCGSIYRRMTVHTLYTIDVLTMRVTSNHWLSSIQFVSTYSLIRCKLGLSIELIFIHIFSLISNHQREHSQSERIYRKVAVEGKLIPDCLVWHSTATIMFLLSLWFWFC